MPDTIYDDLKQQGLIISEGVVLQLPPIRPPKPTLLKQVSGVLAPQFKIGPGPHKVVILPILNSAVLVGRANTLICYKFELDKQLGKPVFLQPKIENLSITIKALHICDNKFLNDRGEVPFLIESENQLTLYYVSLKQYKLTETNSYSYSKLYSVRFLCEKEILLLTRELEIHHFTIQSGKMRMKNKKQSAALPNIPDDQYIQNCQIVGSIDEEQDSLVAMFYLIKKKKKEDTNFEILKVKQYLRTFEGYIKPQQEDYTVLMNTHSSVLPEGFLIWCMDGYYCIETKHEILILRKKFKKYLFIDNVMEKIHDHSLKLNQGAIVSSYGNNAIELSVIQFGDPKCNSRILDTIEINPQISQGFRLLWPFKNQKQTCVLMVFQREKKLIFHNVIKLQPMKKMLEVVQKCDKNKISVVQQIAVNLGINKKDFYLTLWQNSKRQISDIYQFLLPCGDITSIKKEIRLTLRRRKIIVPQFVKILQRISQIIRNELKTNLTQQMLKQYIKNDFLLRKIKLKPKEKSLDHRDLDKVYNSSIIDIFVEIVKNKLFPEQKKVDPLHAMVIEPEKQLIELQHVFQQFRLVILQNYKKFLVDFLSHFTKDQLVTVIQNYQFLLPLHPFQITLYMHEAEYKTEVELFQQMVHKHNGQQQWFSNITSVQFNREVSKESIQRELHEYYPTSKITEAIKTLVSSSYGATEKLKKHALISCTIDQYKNKLKDICDIKLFLKVCEYANEIDPYDNDGPSPSPKLLQIFKNDNKPSKENPDRPIGNKLTGEAYETVQLYTSMHKFMLKNDFCENKASRRSFTTEELMQFTPEDLVALFFLENRQRKEFLFNEFRDLYGNPEKFNKVIEKFILSENCSRIELEIFIKELLNKGVEFQIDNQPLIELLIDGFCMKLQIRQGSDTQHFIDLMNDIELSKSLGMKLNKIMQIQRCVGILNVFHCEKFTYHDMLSYQKDNQIFKILLQRFFEHQIKRDTVRIEDEDVSLDYCRNMLTVLLYILETIYYDVSEKEMLLTYGEMLILWKQFDVIKSILYEEDFIEKLGIVKADYIDELVRKSLASIYTDESIEFDEEVKRHIEDILDIMQDEGSALRKQQLAKLKLVEIFESWEVLVHPYDIYYVCEEWNENNGREDFIVNLFDVYLDKLTLSTLQQIYEYLEYTGEPREEESERVVTLYNSEFVRFVLMFAQRLLNSKRYDQIIEIFSFVKTMNGTVIEYDLLTEAFLKSVCKDFANEDQLEQGKQLIEYFTQNVFDDQLLQKLFETKFASGRFGDGIDRQSTILVDSNYCFRKHKIDIPVDLLWSIVMTEKEELFKNTQGKRVVQIPEIYYCYYFILNVFRNPVNGLRKLDRISYNLELLTNLLFRLEATVDSNPNLWAINTFYIYKSFIKGLLLIGVGRVKQGDSSSYQFKNQEDNAEVIKNVLKEDKTRNKDLLDCIGRIEAHLSIIRNPKNKELRFIKATEEELRSRPVEVPVQPQPEIIVNTATLKLKTMREMKLEQTQNLSHLSVNVISQNEILDAIYAKAFEQKQQERARQKRSAAAMGNNLFLTGMGVTDSYSKKQSSQKLIVQKILKEEYEQVLHEYSKEDIIPALKTIYEEGKKDFFENMRLLQTLKIGQKQRIDISRLCGVYQGYIPTEDLQRIFPFDFFLQGEQHQDEDLAPKVYNAIRQNIQRIFLERNNEYIRSIATFVGSVLESNLYIDFVYLDTLLNIGQYDFNSEAVIRFRVIVDILRTTSPDVIRHNIQRILISCKDNSEMRAVMKDYLLAVVRQQFDSDSKLNELIANG